MHTTPNPRYRVETWDALASRCLLTAWVNAATLADWLDDRDDRRDALALAVGQTLNLGGGAAPITRITREA